jgi:cobalt-zinc-cadmium efflux system outer membrane protein
MSSKYFCWGLLLATLALSVFATESSSSQVEHPTRANEAVIATLRATIFQIHQQNPAVRAAEAAVSALDAERTAVEQSRHNPSLVFETESAAEITTTIGLSQTIDWNDKRAAAVDVAASELQAAAAELTVARRSAGDLGQGDLALARVAFSEASMQQAISSAECAEAKVVLRALTGNDNQDPPTLPKQPPAVLTLSDIEALLDRIPELVVAQNRINASQARVEVAKRARQPDPTFSARGGRDGSDTLLALSVEIPLFVRNPMTAPVRVAEHQTVQETQTYLDLRRQARARLDAALTRYRLMAQAWEVWVAEGRTSLKEQVELSEQLWQAGELSAADYLLQAKQSVDTQVAAAELAGRVWQAAIAYLDTAGRVDEWLGIERKVNTSNRGETP